MHADCSAVHTYQPFPPRSQPKPQLHQPPYRLLTSSTTPGPTIYNANPCSVQLLRVPPARLLRLPPGFYSTCCPPQELETEDLPHFRAKKAPTASCPLVSTSDEDQQLPHTTARPPQFRARAFRDPLLSQPEATAPRG